MLDRLALGVVDAPEWAGAVPAGAWVEPDECDPDPDPEADPDPDPEAAPALGEEPVAEDDPALAPLVAPDPPLDAAPPPPEPPLPPREPECPPPLGWCGLPSTSAWPA